MEDEGIAGEGRRSQVLMAISLSVSNTFSEVLVVPPQCVPCSLQLRLRTASSGGKATKLALALAQAEIKLRSRRDEFVSFLLFNKHRQFSKLLNDSCCSTPTSLLFSRCAKRKPPVAGRLFSRGRFDFLEKTGIS